MRQNNGGSAEWDTLPAGRVPIERQLAEPEEGLMSRLIEEVRQLGANSMALVELRLRKIQIEVEEKIDAKTNAAVSTAIFAALGGLAAVFILVALALFIGTWLGNAAWGFLIVGVFLGICGAAVKMMNPHLVEIGSKKAVVEEKKLSPNAPQGEPKPVTVNGSGD
jgi:uncharacterized membrane protein YqjE